ncbi:MAG: glycerophosphodiester phosphodiesterase [Bacteroidetes bacterium]|jgi:glycerophosphoryl diester phosphodiesterase|nr:glycerophosphodiester phosphodiesterase [Bacteroidota bacterium]
MRRLPVLLVVLLLMLGTGVGCYTATEPIVRSDTPAYARAAEHYVAFETADALAAALRYDAPTGPLISAHRGGPMRGYPENALATFEHTLRYGPAFPEVDVRMTRDSVLVLLHDETLERTTTGRGALADHTLAETRRLLLKDPMNVITPFRMPTLAEALAWAEGRAVLQLDVKRGVPPETVVDAVRRHDAANRVIVITYTLDALRRYHRLAPDLVLSATAETAEEVEAILGSGVDPSRLIVFTGVGTVRPAVIDQLHAHNIRAILGTFGAIDERAARVGPEVFQALIDQGVDVLATDNVRVAARAVQAYEAVPAR